MVVRDYRDLDALGPFDAVASVGMFEHVGREQLPIYFRAALGALQPGGLFLNHGIATAAPSGILQRRWVRFADRGFLGRYVFLDGELVTVEDAIGSARKAGFELVDVQSLRAHYALTLKAWVGRLEASATRARDSSTKRCTGPGESTCPPPGGALRRARSTSPSFCWLGRLQWSRATPASTVVARLSGE